MKINIWPVQKAALTLGSEQWFVQKLVQQISWETILNNTGLHGSSTYFKGEILKVQDHPYALKDEPVEKKTGPAEQSQLLSEFSEIKRTFDLWKQR